MKKVIVFIFNVMILLWGNGQAYYICQEAEKYFYGVEGREQSYEKSFNLYEKAAKEGCVLAEYKLAGFYELGLGVDSSYRMAFKWLKIAAKHGYPDAQYDLGFYYFFGWGCKEKPKKTFNLDLKAANNGSESARKALQEWGMYKYNCGYNLPELYGEEGYDWYHYFMEEK